MSFYLFFVSRQMTLRACLVTVFENCFFFCYDKQGFHVWFENTGKDE